MRNNLSKATIIRLRVLAWYQIVGGIVGLLVSIWLLARTETVNGLMMLLFMLAFVLYGYSAYCGRLLLGSNYNKGLTLSYFNQALQVVIFSFAGYSFMYVSGAMVLAGIKYISGGVGLTFAFNFSLTSTWRFWFATNDLSFELSINFVAIYLLIFIDKLRQRVTKDKQDQEAIEMEKAVPDI